MLVGAPTVDANGVKSYAVTSVFQGPAAHHRSRPGTDTIPLPASQRRFLYVLPVEIGVTRLELAIQ